MAGCETGHVPLDVRPLRGVDVPTAVPDAPKKIDLGGLQSYSNFKFNPEAQGFVPRAAGQRSAPDALFGSLPMLQAQLHFASGHVPMAPPMMQQFQRPQFAMPPCGYLPLGHGLETPTMYQPTTVPSYPCVRAVREPSNGGANWSEQSSSSSRRSKSKGTEGPAKPEPIPPTEEFQALNMVRNARERGTQCELTLQDVQASLVEFAKDEVGSQFLIDRMEACVGELDESVCHGLLEIGVALSCHQFGYRVVQKLFDVGSRPQKDELVDVLHVEVLNLACDQYGCHVIQHVLLGAPPDMQLRLTQQLHDVVKCIKSPHGNHVIQKCVELMPPKNVGFIIDAIQDRAREIAGHRFGCRVILRLFEYCSPQDLEVIHKRILDCVADLTRSPYGNYIVRQMISAGTQQEKQRILKVVSEDIVEFSKGKWSSNVVEKCFGVDDIGLEEERRKLFEAVLASPDDPCPPLLQMTRDRYGQYVVQRILEHSGAEHRDLIQKQIDKAEGLECSS